MLKHPVISSFLLMKWQRIRTFYIISLIIYFFFVFFLTLLILLGKRISNKFKYKNYDIVSFDIKPLSEYGGCSLFNSTSITQPGVDKEVKSDGAEGFNGGEGVDGVEKGLNGGDEATTQTCRGDTTGIFLF